MECAEFIFKVAECLTGFGMIGVTIWAGLGAWRAYEKQSEQVDIQNEQLVMASRQHEAFILNVQSERRRQSPDFEVLQGHISNLAYSDSFETFAVVGEDVVPNVPDHSNPGSAKRRISNSKCWTILKNVRPEVVVREIGISSPERERKFEFIRQIDSIEGFGSTENLMLLGYQTFPSDFVRSCHLYFSLSFETSNGYQDTHQFTIMAGSGFVSRIDPRGFGLLYAETLIKANGG